MLTVVLRLFFRNPNGEDGGPDSMVGPHAWTKFGSNSGNYLKIGSTSGNLTIEILQNFRQEKTALWNILVSNLASACPRPMESVTNSVNMFLLIGLITSILTFVLLLASCICFVHIRHKKSYRKKSEVANGKPTCPVNVWQNMAATGVIHAMGYVIHAIGANSFQESRYTFQKQNSPSPAYTWILCFNGLASNVVADFLSSWWWLGSLQ